MAHDAIIQFEHASLAYHDVAVLRDLSASIAPRSFVALIGGSGAGKTTMLKCINRLIELSAGTLRIEGRDVQTHDPVELRRRIGYVFQGLGLFPHMSVAENIAITPNLLGWPTDKRSARVKVLLDLVGLPQSYAPRSPTDLSGGQRQRVALARALAAEPPIMLLDEAFGALDPLTRDEVSSAYRTIHDQLGLTTVMVTHDIQEAMLLADRILVLADGRIVADGTPASLADVAEPADVAAMLSMPRRQAQRLQDRLTQPRPVGNG